MLLTGHADSTKSRTKKRTHQPGNQSNISSLSSQIPTPNIPTALRLVTTVASLLYKSSSQLISKISKKVTFLKNNV